MHYANSQTTGGYINGAALYCCGYSMTYEIFHSTIENWICNDCVTKFEGLDYLKNVPLMLENAREFSSTGCHQNIFNGVIGSLDGWFVKIC